MQVRHRGTVEHPARVRRRNEIEWGVRGRSKRRSSLNRTSPPFPGRADGWGRRGRGDLTAEWKKSVGLLNDLRPTAVRTDWIARQAWDPEGDADEPPVVVKRKPRTPPPPRKHWKVVAALLVVFLGASALGWISFDHGIGPGHVSDFIGHRWKDESADHFTFAAAGDFGSPDSPDSIALAARARSDGASFLVALGDFERQNDAGWCRRVSRYIPELVLVAGDVGEDSDEAEGPLGAVQSCPYALSSPYVPGNGTLGYGFDYYFDYPHEHPLARFVMISAGLREIVGYDYTKRSPHFEWAEDVVKDARDHLIPWVIVGVHKQCLTADVEDDCSMGQDIFDELVEEKVDLILMGNDLVYERSRQLHLSDSCPSINGTKEFDESCVIRQDHPDAYEKGKGTVVVVQGVGGLALDNVTIDRSNSDMGYFHQVMGRNANTEARLPGFGSVFYKVTADAIIAETDFCPSGQVAANGACLTNRASVFTDRFEISEHPSEPIPSPGAVPPSEPGVPPTVPAAVVPRSDGFVAGGNAPSLVPRRPLWLLP